MTLNLFEKALVDRSFRTARRGIEDVGAVADEREDTLIAHLGQFLVRSRLANDGILVELPVAGMENTAMRGIDQQGIAFRDRVRERDIGHLERADLEAAVIVGNGVELHLAQHARLFQLPTDQFHRERRRIDGHTEVGREVRDRADMVFMRMGQHDGFELVDAFLDEIEVRKYQVDTGILGSRERHAQIDHQPAALAAVQVDVHANFARPAKGQEQQFVFGSEIFLQAEALSARMARPVSVRSLSTASNRSVISSNRSARPPVATTFAGRPISPFIRDTRPSISAT